MDKNEKIKSLDKQISNMSSTIMRQEEYFENLKSRIKTLEKTEEDIKAKIPILEKGIKEEKQELSDYKKVCLDEITQKQVVLRTQKEQIENQNSGSDTRTKELAVLSTQLHAGSDRLTKDKRDISNQKRTLQEQNTLLKIRGGNLLEEEESNRKKSKLLTQIESSLNKQQERIETQLKGISTQLTEISEGRKTNALKVLEINIQQRELDRQKIEQEEKVTYLRSETKKLDTLCNSWNERLKEVEKREKSYSKSLETLKNYENELELKRLTLLNEARKKDIKLKIEKFK